MARNRNRPASLVHQVKEKLNSITRYGQSKHQDKLDHIAGNYIYSYDTRKAYLRHGCDFVLWCRDVYGCRILEDCRQYAAAYIAMLQQKGQSPSTLKLKAAAIAKLYSCTTAELGIVTPDRRRADITRSRGIKKSDKHFSETRNEDLIAFCRGTGLRNHKELQQLHGNQLECDNDGQYWLMNIVGKGGKKRNVPVLPDYEDVIAKYCRNAGDGLVWPHVSSHADIDSYRADYAMAWYERLARDEIPKSEQYHCRRELVGVTYDKAAMQIVSRYLGHNRIGEIAGHYLHR